MEQEDVVVWVLGRLGRWRRAEVGRGTRGLGREDRGPVLRLAGGGEVLEEGMEDGSAGCAIGEVNVSEDD